MEGSVKLNWTWTRSKELLIHVLEASLKITITDIYI